MSVVLTGLVSGTDIADTIAAIYAHPDWQAGFNAYCDSRAVRDLLIDKQDLPRITALQGASAAIAGPGLDVLVVQRQGHRAIAEMYSIMMGSSLRQTRICETPEQAAAILGQSV